MGEKVPRRMRRFYREGKAPEAGKDIELGEMVLEGPETDEKAKVNKEITMQLALNEVEKFKKEHKRLPKKDEYDKIAESIYSQMKDKEERKKALKRLERNAPKEKRARPERERGRAAEKDRGDIRKQAAFSQMQQAAKGMSEKDIKGMSVQDLFGEGESKKEGAKALEDEFGLGTPKKGAGQNGLGLGQENDEFSLGELTDLNQPEEKSGQKCPKCGKPAENIIFCPECGTAFCENCAKKVGMQGKAKIITCPECGHKIKK